MNHLKSVLLAVGLTLIPLSAVHSQVPETTICRALGWGTDLQANFSSRNENAPADARNYKVALCQYGMGATHMVIFSDYGVNIIDNQNVILKSLSLDIVGSVGDEQTGTIGTIDNGFFDRATDGDKVYRLIVNRGKTAEFKIEQASQEIYSHSTNKIKFESVNID